LSGFRILPFNSPNQREIVFHFGKYWSCLNLFSPVLRKSWLSLEFSHLRGQIGSKDFCHWNGCFSVAFACSVSEELLVSTFPDSFRLPFEDHVCKLGTRSLSCSSSFISVHRPARATSSFPASPWAHEISMRPMPLLVFPRPLIFLHTRVLPFYFSCSETVVCRILRHPFALWNPPQSFLFLIPP